MVIKNNIDMKKNKIFRPVILIFLTILILSGCKEDLSGPIVGGGASPGQISNISVENLPGKAKLSYTLPGDQDLLYIKAVYEIRPGVVREIKSSYYNNGMELDGFSNTNEYQVTIYAVNRAEVQSQPITITVKPLENPIWEIFRSLKVLPDFAGVRITASNPNAQDVAIEIVRKDSTGKWIPYLPYIYSSQKDISFTSRGLDTITQEFGVTVRDRFLNYTDTIYKKVNPLYEEQLNKTLFKEVKLPGDAAIQKVTGGIPLMWDGNADPNQSQRMLTEPSDPNPQWITIDLGQLAKLSRIKIWNYAEYMSSGRSQFFYRGQTRIFEVWGSDKPDSDGSWGSWIKLGTYTNVKPSGLPYGQNSSEDHEVAKAGFDYNFDPNAAKVRYLRIKNLENWMGTTWFEILEINVYGDTR